MTGQNWREKKEARKGKEGRVLSGSGARGAYEREENSPLAGDEDARQAEQQREKLNNDVRWKQSRRPCRPGASTSSVVAARCTITDDIDLLEPPRARSLQLELVYPFS